MRRYLVTLAGALLGSCATLAPPPAYDLLIRNGTIVDGRGGAPFVGDVAVTGERIVAVAPSIRGTAVFTLAARARAPSIPSMTKATNSHSIASVHRCSKTANVASSASTAPLAEKA